MQVDLCGPFLVILAMVLPAPIAGARGGWLAYVGASVFSVAVGAWCYRTGFLGHWERVGVVTVLLTTVPVLAGAGVRVWRRRRG
jgi:hypothetical protein